jgi:DNA polymerase III epsilon subunit-like protein
MDGSAAASETPITVLDYESTGSLRGFPNEPWQIGMVSLVKGQVDPASMFDSLLRIDINRPFNLHAPGRHDMLRHEMTVAPTVEELWGRVRGRITASPLCAHNVSTEKKFLRAMAPMHHFGPWIDTLVLARKAWPGRPSYALEDLVNDLSLKPQVQALCPGREAHDALYDAVASAALLSHLLQQPGWECATVAELASL